MRESVALLIMVGILTWIGFSRWDSIAPRVGTPSDRTSQRSSVINPGGTNETSRIGPVHTARSTTRPAKAEKLEAETSSSKRSTREQHQEDEELLTIYPGQIDKQVDEHSSTSAKRPGPVARKSKPKMVHGVPIESWILSRRNRVAEAPRSEEEGLRVYLQCLELSKKEDRGLKKGECKGLIANRVFPEPTKSTRDKYY